MSTRTARNWLRQALIGFLMIAVVLLAAAAKRSQYPAHPGPASHLSKLVKMSESRIESHVADAATLHPPAVVLKSDFAFSAAPPVRLQSRSLPTSLALLAPPLRV